MYIENNFLRKDEVIVLVYSMLKGDKLPYDKVLVDRIEYDGAEYRSICIRNMKLSALMDERLIVRYDASIESELKMAGIIR